MNFYTSQKMAEALQRRTDTMKGLSNVQNDHFFHSLFSTSTLNFEEVMLFLKTCQTFLSWESFTIIVRADFQIHLGEKRQNKWRQVSMTLCTIFPALLNWSGSSWLSTCAVVLEVDCFTAPTLPSSADGMPASPQTRTHVRLPLSCRLPED